MGEYLWVPEVVLQVINTHWFMSLDCVSDENLSAVSYLILEVPSDEGWVVF